MTPSDPSFNGAAHLRARRLPTQSTAVAVRKQLQRGRALARAEITLKINPSHRETCGLQRGRALARAEIPGLQAPDTKIPKLQRGRALARAEIRTGDLARRQSHRFNGAAHLHARRCRRHRCDLASPDGFNGAAHCARGDVVAPQMDKSEEPLQRGRALARAEIADDLTEAWGDLCASTGPRTCARGDYTLAVAAKT